MFLSKQQDMLTLHTEVRHFRREEKVYMCEFDELDFFFLVLCRYRNNFNVCWCAVQMAFLSFRTMMEL
jgi:hypothetical protein